MLCVIIQFKIDTITGISKEVRGTLQNCKVFLKTNVKLQLVQCSYLEEIVRNIRIQFLSCNNFNWWMRIAIAIHTKQIIYCENVRGQLEERNKNSPTLSRRSTIIGSRLQKNQSGNEKPFNWFIYLIKSQVGRDAPNQSNWSFQKIGDRRSNCEHSAF